MRRAASASHEGNMPFSPCIRAPPATASRRSSSKADAEIFGVRPALEHPNVTLLTNALVTRLTTDAAGRR